MSTGDRVAKLFDMLQVGAINADEYAALKKEAFLEPRSEAPVTPQVGDVASLAQMQKQMAQIANAVQDLASGLKRPASTPGPADVIEVQPALTEIVPSKKIKLCEEPVRGQKSLFQVGCNSTIERGGRKFTLKETQVPAQSEASKANTVPLVRQAVHSRPCPRNAREDVQRADARPESVDRYKASARGAE